MTWIRTAKCRWRRSPPGRDASVRQRRPDVSRPWLTGLLSLLVGAFALGCGAGDSDPGRDSGQQVEAEARKAFETAMGKECRALKARSARAVKMFDPVRKSGLLPNAQQIPALVMGYRTYAKQLERSARTLEHLEPPTSQRSFLTDYVALVRDEGRGYRRAALGLSGAAPPRVYDPLDLSRPRNLQIALIDERGGQPMSCGEARLP